MRRQCAVLERECEHSEWAICALIHTQAPPSAAPDERVRATFTKEKHSRVTLDAMVGTKLRLDSAIDLCELDALILEFRRGCFVLQ